MEEKGESKLEGMTNVIIDEQVIENVSEYLNEKHIQKKLLKLPLVKKFDRTTIA